MRILIALAAFVMLALTNLSAQAAPVPDALRTELKLLAEDVAKIIQKKGGGAVAIGEFGGSVEVVGHSGPGIQLTLSEELQAAGISIENSNHRFEISGRYQPFHDTAESREKAGGKPQEATNLNAVKLVAFLIDKETGEPLAERPTGRLIFGSETVPAILGLNTSNKPLRDPRDLSDSFAEARRKPQVDLSGSRITGKSGQFAIEVIVKQGDEYNSKPVKMEKGHPFTALDESDIYGVRLINNSPHEVAVDLRIDGINAFAFSDSKSHYWIVSPRSSSDVYGWHRSDKVTTEFKVVANFPDTAASKLNLKPSPSIGLITASFSASWEKDEDRPADEPELEGRGTGFGDDIDLNTIEVSRTIGQIRDNLSVRYEK